MFRLVPTLLVAAAATLTTTLAVAGGLSVVSQKSRAFAMRDLQISRGDTVRFTNDDAFLHQVFVRSASMNYESAEQEPGQAVDVVFSAAGTFEVRCEIHPKMLLNVAVR